MTKHKSNNYTATLWQLFVTFLKIGAFTFGGGYAMISIVEEEVVSKKKWITAQDMLDMIVIAESTPGVIAVNTATSVGYNTRGVLGAIIATIGVVLPSFCIIIGLSFAIEAFADNIWYQSAFAGIQVCVLVLILNAFLKLSKQVQYNWFTVSMLAVAFVLAVFTDINVILIIIAGGLAGIIYQLCHKPSQSLPLDHQDVGEQLEQNLDKLSSAEEQLDDKIADMQGEEQ